MLRRFTDEEWEEITYHVAHLDHGAEGDVKLVSAPDHGLDVVLLTRDANAKCLRGWQSKNYPAPLQARNWRECRRSLERAIASWAPMSRSFFLAI